MEEKSLLVRSRHVGDDPRKFNVQSVDPTTQETSAKSTRASDADATTVYYRALPLVLSLSCHFFRNDSETAMKCDVARVFFLETGVRFRVVDVNAGTLAWLGVSKLSLLTL
ncbi:hypothetical protein PsorP6_008075 [Peronosclerospora sorghi]|uniref:Uncharacterized protein n=1 Tax=Peronosclerospora sorghi TaxID=230839 RepID=A0ACC0W744_9STRA|nr:hypothetical protein PsorP6_008075 [Peronosclerospora sorghi]